MSWEVQRAGDLPKPMNDDGPRLSRPRFTRHALLLNCLFPTRQDETRRGQTSSCACHRPDRQRTRSFSSSSASPAGSKCTICMSVVSKAASRGDVLSLPTMQPLRRFPDRRPRHPSVAATADELTQVASPTDRVTICSDRVTIWVGSRSVLSRTLENLG